MPISHKGTRTNGRILGLDPGYASLGYAVIEGERGRYECLACGVLTSSPKEPLPRRLMNVSRSVRELCDRYAPERIAIEQLFFFKNQKTVINVAQARGAVLAALASYSALITEFTPLQVKQSVTGDGRATKHSVAKILSLLLPGAQLPKDDNALDALAIALTAAFRRTLS